MNVARAYVPSLAERDEPFFEAAVALILREHAAGAGIEVLLIERAAREGDPWSGQIAFPGGRRDPGDVSLEDTAMRETWEEVAIDLRKDGTLIGVLDELRPRTPVLPPVVVRPFVATVPAHVVAHASTEVAAAFWAPLDELLSADAVRDTDIMVRDFRTRRPAIHFDGRVIWGMTERILANFRSLLT